MSSPVITRIQTLPLCELGEAPHWDEGSKSLLYVDAFKSKIHRYFPESEKHQVVTIEPVAAESGDSVTFVIPVENEPNLFLISVGRHIGLIKWSESDPAEKTLKLAPLVEIDQDRPSNRLNDGKCDFKGQLWAGTKGVETSPGVIEKERGNLFVFSESFKPKIASDKINLSNGLTWSHDQKTFYYIDTGCFSVDSFDFNSEANAIENRRKLVDYKKVGLLQDCPDGMTIDNLGNLWVANYLGSKILNIEPKEGRVLRTIDLPIENPTCVAWGGHDFCELFLTTSHFGFSDAQLRETPDSGGVFRICGLGVHGRAPHKARVDAALLGHAKAALA